MADASKDSKQPVEAAKDSKQQDIAFDEDAFEEFEQDEWNIITHEEENADLWQADWDDEDVADDFQQKLQEMRTNQGPAPMTT